MKEIIYISIPKEIGFNVLEALYLHADYFESTNRDVVYLSLSNDVEKENVKLFRNRWQQFKYLRKQKNAIFYGITVFEVLLGYLSKLFGNNKTIIYWVQGLIDEEDFFKYGKKYRYYIFYLLMLFSIKVSDKLVVVTNEMFRVLVEKYACSTKKEHLVLNCTSRVSYNQMDKIENSLCYIGGLSKWQNMDKILNFFNLLPDSMKSYTLHIATFDFEEMHRLINKFVDEKNKSRIALYKVRETGELRTFLSKMEYGFLIRDNVLLNNVASPIKLAEYLSCGVNPIISNSLVEFEYLIEQYNCGIVIKGNEFNNAIRDLEAHKPVAQNAISLYKNYFDGDEKLNEIGKFL